MKCTAWISDLDGATWKFNWTCLICCPPRKLCTFDIFQHLPFSENWTLHFLISYYISSKYQRSNWIGLCKMNVHLKMLMNNDKIKIVNVNIPFPCPPNLILAIEKALKDKLVRLLDRFAKIGHSKVWPNSTDLSTNILQTTYFQTEYINMQLVLNPAYVPEIWLTYLESG